MNAHCNPTPFTGTSVGIIIPCMPLLVSQLHIPPSEFGLVISAFGLSKLIGNIPSGYFVEKYGRKPIIMAGLGMCGVGLGSIGEHNCIVSLLSVLWHV